MASEVFAFPDHGIDPRKKDYDWVLSYHKAAWGSVGSYTPSNSFWLGRSRYAEIKQYTMAKQSITKYKKKQAGDELDNNTEINNDYSVASILPKSREIAISKIVQRQYDAQAYAVDPIAKSEEDDYFNKMKAKVLMRQAAMQAGSPLADSPAIRANPNEPEDMEQLQMQRDFSYKHVMAMSGEEAAQLILQQNGIDRKRVTNIENSFDWGISGWRIWIDANGMVKFREISGDNLITSYCEQPDYSDAVHAFEVINVKLVDLRPYFSDAQMDDIQKNVAGKFKNGSPMNTFSRAWEKTNVLVLDGEFLSWNTTVYETEIDNRGNERFRKTDFGNLSNVTTSEDERGAAEPKYIGSTRKVKYKGKWLIDTKYMYDWGLAENQNRKLSSWWDTELDFILDSWNFYKMQFSGITERLIPIADAFQLTWMKLQNLKSKLIPYLINLDLNALESVGLGKGGANMTPAEVVDFAMSNFVSLYRSTDLLSSNPNYKPMTIEASGQLQAFVQLYQDLDRLYLMMQQVSGLNEYTDGSTPNAKSLTATVETANVSTNNALYMIMQSDKRLMCRLVDAIIQKVQIAIQLGKVEGYAKALGSETVKFMSINPALSNHELGIFIEEMPTEEQRNMFLQEINMKEGQGLIEPQDKLIAMSFKNLKHGQQYFAYIVNKRKQAMQQAELQKIQMNNQGQQQMALAAAKAEQETIMLQAQLDIQKITVEKQWDFVIEKMKSLSDETEADTQAQAKIIGNKIMADAKVTSDQIKAKTAAKKTA